MSKRAKERIRQLESLLEKAARHIDSAADVIESLGGDDDEECADEREFAAYLRRTAKGARIATVVFKHRRNRK